MKALLARRLARQSTVTGISKAQLRRLCLRVGLELLERGELVIKAPEPKR